MKTKTHKFTTARDRFTGSGPDRIDWEEELTVEYTHSPEEADPPCEECIEVNSIIDSRGNEIVDDITDDDEIERIIDAAYADWEKQKERIGALREDRSDER